MRFEKRQLFFSKVNIGFLSLEMGMGIKTFSYVNTFVDLRHASQVDKKSTVDFYVYVRPLYLPLVKQMSWHIWHSHPK